MTNSIFSFVAIVSNKTKSLETINLILAKFCEVIAVTVRYTFDSEDYIKMYEWFSTWYRICTHIHKKSSNKIYT